MPLHTTASDRDQEPLLDHRDAEERAHLKRNPFENDQRIALPLLVKLVESCLPLWFCNETQCTLPGESTERTFGQENQKRE
jgi:hypothetical protein